MLIQRAYLYNSENAKRNAKDLRIYDMHIFKNDEPSKLLIN